MVILILLLLSFMVHLVAVDLLFSSMVFSFGESWTADDTAVVPPSVNRYVSGLKSVIVLPWRAGLRPGRVQNGQKKRPCFLQYVHRYEVDEINAKILNPCCLSVYATYQSHKHRHHYCHTTA